MDCMQLTKLLRPWDFPGKSTGVGCHFLLQCMKVKSESEVSQSHPPFSNPMDCMQPTRLLCPWDFPGKSTGVGCHCLLRVITMGIWYQLPCQHRGTNFCTAFLLLSSEGVVTISSELPSSPTYNNNTHSIGQEMKMKIVSVIKMYLFLPHVWGWRSNHYGSLWAVSQTQARTPCVTRLFWGPLF